MAFGTTNIEQVKAMSVPAGQRPKGGVVAQAGVMLVSWRSGETDKLFQVYVNGRLMGASAHRQQRALLVEYDHTHPAVIEVVWVRAQDRYVDYARQLNGFTEKDGVHAVVSLPRRGTMELGSRAKLFWDAGTGVMDYSQPLMVQEVWPEPEDKWGWGQDGFGRGDFGYSSTAAPGWGRGSFGEGEFGFDADKLVFESEALPRGTYQFAVRLTDAQGNAAEGEAEIVTVSIDPVPEGPGLAIESYDSGSNELVLNIKSGE
jgi:hypothetical protein